ncbi:MAG: SRPBCC family protein [Dysgonamonadaceae bacterium]|jgi:carbon monoxide dehydrogenase subunit G|nr:SRPBCC family protein [Dysgonamonadaceae bacterium]
MTEFTSDIKILPYNQEKIYKVLSNMDNLERIKDKIPYEKVTDFSFDQDSCSFSVNPVGKVKFSIIERKPVNTIKFAADQAPVEVNMWIQLLPVAENESKMKLTVKANLNPFLKPMLSRPLQDGVNKIADILATVPYDEVVAKEYTN